MDSNFKYNLTKQGFYFTSSQNLFEFDDLVPFKTNQKFVNWVYVDYDFFKWFDLSYKWASSDLLSSFYYEPFFFFRDKIEQALDDYWLITFFREWTLLFDMWVFRDEEEIKNRKIIYQPLANLYHKSELKSGLKVFKRIFSYKDKQKFSSYLILEDVQDLSLDKNFLHIWNYWIGAWHEHNIFGRRRWAGKINFLREKLYSPFTHIPSQHYWNDQAYRSYNTWSLNFAFFPDISMMWGHYNVQYDLAAGEYNWFFHFGDTYMDAAVSLKLLKYQITINTWGEFDYLVQDFNFYQPTYFADPVATIRLPMILLMCRKYTSPSNMNVHIWDYNSVFQFKQHKSYADVKGEILFPLTSLDRLEYLWDVPPIDQRMHSFDRVINAYFGYNQSEYLMNYPKWYSNYFDTMNFYFAMLYESEEDKNVELLSTRLIDSLHEKKYNYNSNISIFFNKLDFNLPLKNLFHYLNEKIFDDPGYATTPITWNENFHKFNKINWMTEYSLFHFEILPSAHFNWRIGIAGLHFFDWDLFTKSTYFKKFLLFWEAWDETFFLSFKSMWTLNVELYRTLSGELRAYYIFWTPIDPTVGFEIKFLPFFRYFKYLIGPTLLDKPTIEIFNFITNFISSIPNPYLLFYISDLENLITVTTKKLYSEFEESHRFISIIYYTNICTLVWTRDRYNDYLDFNNMIIKSDDIFKLNIFNLELPNNSDFEWEFSSLILKIWNFKQYLEFYYKQYLESYAKQYLEPYYEKFLKPIILKNSNFKLMIIFDCFRFFFLYDCNRFIKVKIYTVIDGNFTMAMISTYWLEFRSLPLEFFIFGSIIPTEQIKIVERFNVMYSDFIPFLALTYFWNLWSFEDFQNFVLLWTTFQLNKEILNKNENIEYINALNQIDVSSLKMNNLEYERYKNFILKHTLYKSK